jgi:hypothetical protein
VNLAAKVELLCRGLKKWRIETLSWCAFADRGRASLLFLSFIDGITQVIGSAKRLDGLSRLRVTNRKFSTPCLQSSSLQCMLAVSEEKHCTICRDVLELIAAVLVLCFS